MWGDFHAHILTLLFLSFDTGPNTFNENETIAKYEIMDGAPVRGKYSETLKIRTASCLNTELVFTRDKITLKNLFGTENWWSY